MRFAQWALLILCVFSLVMCPITHGDPVKEHTKNGWKDAFILVSVTVLYWACGAFSHLLG